MGNSEFLEMERLRLASSVRADETKRAYAYDWTDFAAWCERVGCEPIPVSADNLALYVTDVLSRGAKISTADRRLRGIGYQHRLAGFSPPDKSKARQVLNGARRVRKERPNRKAALTVDHLREISAKLGHHPRGIRDRAILVLGMATALRRDGLSRLDFGDLSFAEQGMIVHERASKNDQAGVGRDIAVFYGERDDTCPVRAVTAWLEVRGTWDGPLFCHLPGKALKPRKKRLAGAAYNFIIKEAVASIGLDPALYGGHSLRAGSATAAAENGASEYDLMQLTGHKTPEMVKVYIRRANLFKRNPLKGVL